MQFADPRTDFAFKLIFGNENAKEVLISFLNAVLGLEGIYAIADVTIINPYQAPKIATLKHSYLDVKCRDNRGVEFVVEMQVQYVEGFEKRIQYNASKALVGQIPSGVAYAELNQVIAVTIADFVMFTEFKHYLSRHEFRETVSNRCYLDQIRHYFIELPKFTKEETELETTIEKWCYFLKHAGHLEVIPEKLNDPPIRRAFELANRANMTKEEWDAYDDAAVRMQDDRGMVTAAQKLGYRQGHQEGHQEGRQEGRQEGYQLARQDMARTLFRQGMEKEQIANLMGISPEELEKLLS